MISAKLDKIKDRIRKWEFVESVRNPVKMPSYFGFKESGLFKGYDFIILSEIDSNDFVNVYGKRLRLLGLEYDSVSTFTIGIIVKKK